MSPTVTEHFAERVRERIGNVDPETLWNGLQWAIANARTDLVQYEGRQNKYGRRVFRFRVPDGRSFVAVINTVTGLPITVMPLEWWQERRAA